MSLLHKLSSLSIQGNSFLGVEEIGGVPPQEEIRYLLRVQSGEPLEGLNEAKVVLVGESCVGKTSLLKMITTGAYSTDESTTHGITICPWADSHGDDCIKLNFWDFGGQELQHSTHQFFFTKRTLYVLVVLARTEDRYDDVNYWLKLIRQRAGDSPVLVVINKVDLDPTDIDRATLQRNYASICGFVRTSCNSAGSIEKLKAEIRTNVLLLGHVRDKMPASWIKAKRALADMSENYITIDDYKKIFTQVAPDESEADRVTLLRLLHDLGIVIHFHDDPHLAALGILKPEWVTDGVYSVLTDATIKSRNGVFALADLDRILNNEKYPGQARRYILDIMGKFELCYPLRGAQQEFLIPRLLPEQTPEAVISQFSWERGKSLRLILELDVIPSSLITRYIVRNHEQIVEGMEWRGGVVVGNGKNIACIRREIKLSRIIIEVQGEESSRRDFLASIREEFGKILNEAGRKTCAELIPISTSKPFMGDKGICAEGTVPLEELKRLEYRGIESHYYPHIDMDVDVRELLNGYRTNKERRRDMADGSQINIHVEGARAESNSSSSPHQNVQQNNRQQIDFSFNVEIFKEHSSSVAGNLRCLQAELGASTSDSAKQLASNVGAMADELDKLSSFDNAESVKSSGVLQRIGRFVAKCNDMGTEISSICNSFGVVDIVRELGDGVKTLCSLVGLSLPF